MVAPLNGGLVLEKVRSLLGADWAELYDSLDAPADPGVRFVPWLAPDRLPRLRAGDAAGWEGIGLATTRSDLLRAAVEAIAFQVDQAVSALPGRPTRIRFAGGGTRDERMRQLICDATGMPGRRSTITDATALGAALLGFRAAGADPVWPVPCEKQELYPRPDPGLMERRERFRQLDARISPG